jgi:hypothetical protein
MDVGGVWCDFAVLAIALCRTQDSPAGSQTVRRAMASTEYDNLLEVARSDARVIGFVLTGSRGRDAFVRAESDWDVRLVVRDDALEVCAATYQTAHGSAVEVVVFSLTGFEREGAIGSSSQWDRYSYRHAQVVLDKLDGRISQMVAEKGVLPSEAAQQIAERALDSYVNSYYRSAKNRRSGLIAEAHLDAVESISPLLDALFAFQERVRPFNKFLRWELEKFPLPGDLWSAERLLARLQTVAATAAIDEQQSLFRDVEQLARSHGFDAIIDGWEPDLAWLRGEPSPTTE